MPLGFQQPLCFGESHAVLKQADILPYDSAAFETQFFNAGFNTWVH